MKRTLVCSGAGRSSINRRTSARRSVTGTPRRSVTRSTASVPPGPTPETRSYAPRGNEWQGMTRQRPTVATDSTSPIIDQPTMGENLLITCQRTVRDDGAVNSPKLPGHRPSSAPPGHAGAGNRVIHKFSPSGQGTLCPVKVFGIIELFERCRGCPRRRARSTMNAVIR
jgi:hypothetical protein